MLTITNVLCTRLEHSLSFFTKSEFFFQFSIDLFNSLKNIDYFQLVDF